MNITLDESYSLKQLLINLCDKVSDNRYNFKKEKGTGYIEFLPIVSGMEFAMGEFTIFEPIVVKWNFKNSDNRIFYLTHIESFNTKTNKEPNFNLAEEGTTLVTQNNHRNVLWLPDVKYKIIDIKFSLDWIKLIDRTFILPENAKTFLNGRSDLLLLHIKKNGDIKQVVNQIFRYKELVNSDAQNIYLNNKTIEILLLTFNISTPISSEKNAKNSVHIDDYHKIINFTDEFSASGIVPDSIETIAKKMGMSRSKFQRIFKLVKGQPYYSFVRDIRMVRAIELLMENKSVTETAYLTGYSAISNFTHAFNNYYKMLPGEFINFNVRNFKQEVNKGKQ